MLWFRRWWRKLQRWWFRPAPVTIRLRVDTTEFDEQIRRVTKSLETLDGRSPWVISIPPEQTKPRQLDSRGGSR